MVWWLAIHSHSPHTDATQAHPLRMCERESLRHFRVERTAKTEYTERSCYVCVHCTRTYTLISFVVRTHNSISRSSEWARGGSRLCLLTLFYAVFTISINNIDKQIKVLFEERSTNKLNREQQREKQTAQQYNEHVWMITWSSPGFYVCSTNK